MTSSWRWMMSLELKSTSTRRYSNGFRRKTSFWKNSMIWTQPTFWNNLSMKLKCWGSKKETIKMSSIKLWAKWIQSPGTEIKEISPITTIKATIRNTKQGMILASITLTLATWDLMKQQEVDVRQFPQPINNKISWADIFRPILMSGKKVEFLTRTLKVLREGNRK